MVGRIFFRNFAASHGSPLRGEACGHVERDVLRRLSCWNINFAKVTTITDGATKRLRCKHDVLATTPCGTATGAAFLLHTCGRGHSIVAYPDG